MSFDARDFLKGGLIGAVGKKPDYKIKLDAMQWYDKGYLEDSDLAEIQEAIDNQYIEPETPIEDETIIEDDAPIIEEPKTEITEE
jgi:hypothetical protein